jgi:hypothetical protein
MRVARACELILSWSLRTSFEQARSSTQYLPWYGTPLHIAISNNHVEAVKILLSAGANMDTLAPDESGAPLDTALTLATRQGRREIVKLRWNR